MLSPEDFADHGGTTGVRLLPSALQCYLAHYEAGMGEAPPGADTPRGRIQDQINDLRRAVMLGQAGAPKAAPSGAEAMGE